MDADRATKEVRETVSNLFKGATAPPAILALRRLGVSNEGIADALGIRSANVASFASGRLTLPMKHVGSLQELLAKGVQEAENAYDQSWVGDDAPWVAAFPNNKMGQEAAKHAYFAYGDSLKYAKQVLKWMEIS